MSMKSFLFLSLSFLGCTFKTSSQGVESKEFSLVLGSLLSHSVKEVGVNEIDSNEEMVFLDAREKREYEVSHIKDAIWVGYDNFKIEPLKGLDKSKKVVVYCSVGYRSEKISEKLVAKGFTNVFNLYGGIFEWKNAGKKVYNSEGNETENIHAYDKLWGRWLRNGNKVYN